MWKNWRKNTISYNIFFSTLTVTAPLKKKFVSLYFTNFNPLVDAVFIFCFLKQQPVKCFDDVCESQITLSSDPPVALVLFSCWWMFVSLLHCDKWLEWASDCRTTFKTRTFLGRNWIVFPHLLSATITIIEMYLFSTLGPWILYQRSRFKIVILLDFNTCQIVIFNKSDFCPQPSIHLLCFFEHVSITFFFLNYFIFCIYVTRFNT